MNDSTFKDVVNKAKGIADAGVRKAEELTKIAKLNYKIGKLENGINDRMAEIGRLYYNDTKSGTDSLEKIQDCISGIDSLYGQLCALKEEVAAEKGQTVCPNCFAYCESGSSFCGKCGSKL